MSKFDSALSVMSEVIFPSVYDDKACYRQAKACWRRAEALDLYDPDHGKYFWLGNFWNRMACKINDEQIKANHEWFRIFGDFITESFRQQRLKKYPFMTK